MHSHGFRQLVGADAFIKEDIEYENGVKIHKKRVEDLAPGYDLIMLHHSFEHMADPLSVLGRLGDLLNPGGNILIRIPVAGSHAWRKYGVHWVQLDAPRHFFLHTPQSMRLLSEKAGLQLADVVYDSYELQFTGSEKYLRGIGLFEDVELFSSQQKQQFQAEARRLNRLNDGDAACFYLQKPQSPPPGAVSSSSP